MKNITLNKINFIGVLFFLINPLISLFYSLVFFIKKQECVLALSLTISLIFIYQPLMYDTSSNFFSYLYNETNNLYNLIPRELKNNLNIDYYYSIFFYTTLIFYCWFKTIKYLSKDIVDKKNLNLLITASIILIIYRDIMDLNRFYLSITLSFYYIFYIKNKYTSLKYITLLFFIIVSFEIHSFSIIIFFSYFIAKTVNQQKAYILFLFFCFFIGVVWGALAQELLFSLLRYSGLNISNVYFGDGGWGHNDYSDSTLLRKILECSIVLSLALFSVIYKRRNNDNNVNLIIFLCGLCFLFFSFKTFFERTFIVLCIYSIYLFSLNFKNGILKYSILLLLLFRFLIINFVRYGDVFLDGHTDVLPNTENKIALQIKPLYYPSLFLLDIDNGYSDKFIIQNSIWKQ